MLSGELMDYERLLEIALKENEMLKNSFNVHAHQMDVMLKRLEAVFYDTERLSRIESNLNNFLDNVQHIYLTLRAIDAGIQSNRKTGRKGTASHQGNKDGRAAKARPRRRSR